MAGEGTSLRLRSRMVSGAGAAALPLHSRIVFYGDGLSSEGSAPGECNYPTVALSMLNGRLRPAVGWMQAASGRTLDLVYSFRDYTINQAPEIVVFGSQGGGAGAIYGTDPGVDPTLINKWYRNLQAIFDGLPSAIIIASTTAYSTNVESFRAQVLALQKAFIASLGSRVHLWDVATLFDPVTMSNDGVHPNQVGGVYLGNDLANNVLSALVVAATADDILNDTGATTQHGANLDTDHALTGTAGTKSGTVTPTGSYATGKRITNNLTNGTAVAVAASKDASPGTYEKQLAVLSGTPAATNTLAQDDTASVALTGGVAGSYFEALMSVEIDNGAGGAPVGFRCWSFTMGALGGYGNSGNLANFAADRLTPVSYVCRMPPLPIFSADSASGNVALTTRWSPTALTGRVIITRPILRKVELVAYAVPFLIATDGIATSNYQCRLTGTAGVGNTLRCDPGKWSGGAIAYTYQWKQDGVAIGGSTATTYVQQAGDSGHTITCTVTATNSFGSATQTPTGVVVP